MVHKPALQLVQSDEANDPSIVDHVPALQLIHAVEPRPDAQDPGLHVVHCADDVAAETADQVPGLQSEQVAAEVAPVFEEKDPA